MDHGNSESEIWIEPYRNHLRVEIRMSVCLVTGGAGFLGSHLVEALVANDHVVRVVDNFTTGKVDNLSAVMDAVELYPGDCGNATFLSKVMRGAELVFHLGCGNHSQDG